ncbi:MAG: hypothetical protein D6814_02745, partial [Calditrichaeota bacterium]
MRIYSEVVLVLALLITLGMLAQKYSRLITNRFGLLGQALIGFEFIILGIVLGPHGIDLISKDALAGLFPIFTLALGWIGLTMMIEADLKTVRRIPVKLGALSAWTSLLTFVLVFAIFTGIFALFHFPRATLKWPVILAIISIPVAPALMNSQLRSLKTRDKSISDLLTLGILDDFHGVLIYLLLFPFVISNYNQQPYFKILLTSLAVGVVSG